MDNATDYERPNVETTYDAEYDAAEAWADVSATISRDGVLRGSRC